MDLRSIVLVSVLAVVGACASGDEARTATGDDPAATSSTPAALPSDEESIEDPRAGMEFDRAPAVVVTVGDQELELQPWTACWGNGCYDGVPPAQLEDVSADLVTVEFPAEGWEFWATRRPASGACGRSQTEPLVASGGTTHRLEVFGRAGTTDVDLFGRGPGGDVFVSFRWTTSVDGRLPQPAASLSLLADHDGEADSYGIELPVRGLAETPAVVEAEVRVTAAGGESMLIDLTPEPFRPDPCPEAGEFFLRRGEAEGDEAARLGERPFTYDVMLRLDGSVHEATAVWPDDVDLECAPCVPLTFDPPLPSLVASG